MFNKNKSKNKKQSKQKGCKGYLGGFVIVFIMIIIFAVYEVLSFDWSLLDTSKYFVEVVESEIVEDKIDGIDMANASTSLYNSGFTSFEYAFSYANYSENSDVPTCNVSLSANQFGSLLNVLVKDDLDSSVNILQLQTTAVEDVITIEIVFYLTINVDETIILDIPNKIYVTETYQLEKLPTEWNVAYLTGIIHNINYELDGVEEFVQSLDSGCILQECMLQWLNGTEAEESILQTLNFTSIEFGTDVVTLVQ